MSNRTRNAVLAIVAILAVVFFAYGGSNGWFRQGESGDGQTGVEGSNEVNGGAGSEQVFLQEAGTLASDQPTNEDGYQASPIGALGSNLPLLCETWGPTPTGDHGFVVTVPAGSVMWEQRHYGGTCWWVDPSDLEAAIQRSVDAITATNGEVPTVVRLPDDSFPLLGCLQSLPVEKDIRHCDAVGGFPGYDSPAENPTPGYFPGYGGS